MDETVAVILQLACSNTAPLLLAALGGLLSERAGVINIALEGMMLAGAFGGALGALWSGSPWLGLAAGSVSGAFLGLLHAGLCVRFRADQIVSGTAINLLALGGSGYLLYSLFGTHGSSPSAPKLPVWDLPLVRSTPTVALAFLLVPVVWVVLYRLPIGLRLRAVGDAPQTAHAAGVHVGSIRTTAVVLSGALAGIGGVHLSLGDLSQFIERMTAGRGFIALAALIFGKWHPAGVLGACVLFGLAEAVADGSQAWSSAVPSQVYLVLPFVLTMVVLAGFVGRSRPPEALGK